MNQTNELIEFYATTVDKNILTFTNLICDIASDFEDHPDERERQRAIMEKMLDIFDTVSVGKEKTAWEQFMNIDSDKVVNYQLETIKGIVRDIFPNVVKSCDIIITEGY